MGIVGGGGNIAISTALPPSFCVLCCKHLLVYGIHISYFFYACLRLRFPDVETNPGPQRPVSTVCRLLCSNVQGLAGNLSDLTVGSPQYDILLCSETLVSDSHHVSEFWFPDLVALSCCVGEGCLEPKGWRRTYEMVTEHFANPSLSVVVAKCWFLGFVVRDRTCMCSVFTATLT